MGMRVTDDNLLEADFGYTLSPKKSAFPANAGTHFSTTPSPDEWIPAFAGNADFRVVSSARLAHREA